MYNETPESEEVIIVTMEDSLSIDWSLFSPPVEVAQYVLMRCADIDGDTDGDGTLEYEICVLIITPPLMYTDMQYLDDFSDATTYGLADISGIKYTLSVGYPNNNYWGSAFGYYYYVPQDDPAFDLGDLNFDGIINVIDVVTLVNGILGDELTDDQELAADLNGDGTINVIDIVGLVNIILG